jgi:hypothetical protein
VIPECWVLGDVPTWIWWNLFPLIEANGERVPLADAGFAPRSELFDEKQKGLRG